MERSRSTNPTANESRRKSAGKGFREFKASITGGDEDDARDKAKLEAGVDPAP